MMYTYTSERSAINSLKEAIPLYQIKMLANGIALATAAKIHPKYEKMDEKYFVKEFMAFERGNNWQMPVKQQSPNNRFISNSAICIVLRQDGTTNALGMEESIYHYLIYRKRPVRTWFDNINMSGSKYKGKPGIHLPIRILDHMKEEGVNRLAKLAVVFSDGKVYNADAAKVEDYFKSIKERMYINEYAVMNTGVPLEGIFEHIL